MMTTITVDSSSNNLNLDSIPIIDMRFLSQSDLNSLSLCSKTESYDLRRSDDIIIPKIDRSIFNESAGSRKQTYSRLRLSSRKPEFVISNHPLSRESQSTNDPEEKQNRKIVSLLHKLFTSKNPKTLQTLINGKYSNFIDTENNPTVFENYPIENRNGVVIDIVELGNLEDPYDPELKRRTIGLEKTDELLGFMRDLEGIWGSRRKKRRIVDASNFGDFLPIGWKLLLSIKRKGGRFSLFCRRYISPNGQQFKSCKEVSLYLISLTRPQEAI